MICAKESGAGFVGVLSGTYGRRDWEKIGETRIIDTVADLIEFL